LYIQQIFHPEILFNMRYFLISLALLMFGRQAPAQSLSGFAGDAVKKQQDLEKQFDGLLDAKDLDQSVREMSAHPHHVGSPGDQQVAEYIYHKFKDWGYDVQVETFQILFPTPRVRRLEMTGPVPYKAVLMEKPVPEDATSGQTSDQLPPYNCWSPDGDVSGELVYVNYGVPEDYDRLARFGIDVKGKIVIARYGHSWRGIKPKVAQEHGAIGCIIYSDPKDDGYYQGDVYPKGAFKNEFGVQRGSVMDMPIYPGDPLTPGIGATKDAKRIDRHDAANLLKIPVLPISYHDAAPLLKALEGPVVPEDWRGALPFPYHTGPGKALVHLTLEFNWDIKTIRDIIARLPGSEYPEQWVVRGNHHDAWVNGASDPLSGQAAMLEEAKALAGLSRTGWKPLRSIVYCAWDAEEPGLIGSTEWVEEHIQEIRDHVVLYINTDDSGRGFFHAEGSHALEPFINEIARDVRDPEAGTSVLERQRSRLLVETSLGSRKKELMERATVPIAALGSGSDYSPFIQHAGVSSLDLGFGGEDAGGDYHSIFDSYDDYRRFKDPGSAYGLVLAETAGRATLRMADAPILPFDFKALHRTINGYAGELTGLLEQMRESTRMENQLIRNKAYAFANDPQHPLLAPPLKTEVPYLNFASLQNALKDLERAGSLEDSLDRTRLTEPQRRSLNQLFGHAEQELLSPDGLPGRPWYRHTLYAPGLYTGYGVKTLPGIREAIEQRDFKQAQDQIEIAAAAIRRLSAYLESGLRQLL
jgi:N-acetylated-alpha-linked acidic dipeptidase